MAAKRDDFMEGFRGSGWNKYSPGYQTGEMWRKALTFNSPASSVGQPPIYIAPTNRAVPPLGAYPRGSSSAAVRSGLSSYHSGPSGNSIKKLSFIAAILGAVLFAVIASGSASGTPVLAAAIMGAAIGGIVPSLFVLLGKLIVFLVRLTIVLLTAVALLALVVGIGYVISIAIK